MFRRRRHICCGLLLLLSGISPGLAVEQVTLQLRWMHSFRFAGYYMAREKGYYRDAGLAVQFLEGGPTVDGIGNVLEGRADFGVASSELVMTREAGKPVVVLASIFQHSPYVLMVREASGIRSPHDLINHHVLIGPENRATELRAMLINEGIDLKQIRIVPPPLTPEKLRDPAISAISGYISNEPFQWRQLGIRYHLLKPIDYSIDFYGDSLFTTESRIAQKPEQVKAFIRASLEGWRYVFDHPEEAIVLVEQKYNSGQRSHDHLLYEYSTMKDLIYPEHIPIGQMNPGRWHSIAKVYAALHLIDRISNMDGFIYDPEKSLIREQEKLRDYLVLGLVLFFFIFFLFFIWGRSLRKAVGMKTQALSAEIERRKDAESLLYNNLKKYEVLFNSFPLGITVCDPNGKVLETNPKSEVLLGISAREHQQYTIDSEHWCIIRQDGSPMPVAEWASVRALRERCLVENVVMGLVKPEGKIIWLHVTAAPLPLAGYGAVIAYHDVSDRKRAEDEIRRLNAELEDRVRERTAQLEAANQELETFAYSVSHDLKAPLRGIDGYSRMLLEDHEEPLDAERQQFLRNIRAGVLQMHALINDLLAYSRMERRALHCDLLDLRALLAGIVADYAAEIERQGATVRLALPLTLQVRADLDGLRQALRNLLDNALKFGRAGVPVEVEMGGRAGEGVVTLWVKDNGIGIDPRFHERIFEIFQRLQRAEDYPGTGIGLAIVRKALRRMGGRVWIESAVGQGTTFFLELPAPDSER